MSQYQEGCAMIEDTPDLRRDPGTWVWVLLLTIVAVLSAAPAQAGSKHGAPTTPGKYTEWNGEIDEIEIVSAWRLADYRRVSVGAFDTSDVKLPEASDNTYEPVKVMLSGAATPFLAGLSEALRPGIAAYAVPDAGESGKGTPAEGEAKTLLIRVKVLTMDPGSRAARYWGGFGAGAARTKVSGELVDAGTGTVLARFTQERRSGVGFGGGGYVELMSRNLRTIGKDVAEFLNAF
jgi:hypothetical protein